MLAPSAAARSAMARPMPRLAPVMNRVLPASVAMLWLPALEVGLAPLEEGAGAFGEVLRRGAGGEALGLGLQLLLQAAGQCAVDQALGHAIGEGRPGGEAERELACSAVELGHRHDAVDDAESERLGGIEPFRQQRQLHRLLEA